jgi:MerR family transcriptional regulator, light-induced transcriptional regulator
MRVSLSPCGPVPCWAVFRRMTDRTVPGSVTVSIAAVERDTGLSKDALRVWERRYGFPLPSRDAFGERTYPVDQVDKLRLLKRLIDQGHRPGKIIGRSFAELQQLAEGPGAPPGSTSALDGADDLVRCLDCVAEHRPDELRRLLYQRLLRLGLARFITDVVAPLSTMIGDEWARGRLQIFEEHQYTEAMQSILRGAIATIPHSAAGPRVLLTTFPQEPHGLGVLMVEAMLALDGACCIPLGTQTPLSEIVSACKPQQIDVVALSFTPIVNPNQILDGLADLRSHLPDSIEIWAGGSAPVLRRRPPPDIRVLVSLSDVAPAAANWRERHGFA